MSKFFERLKYDKRYNFLISNNTSTNKNSGFRSGDGTLYLCHTNFTRRLVMVTMRIVFMDMSKAFDKVWHKGVIFKLKKERNR